MVVQIIIKSYTGQTYTVALYDTEFQGATVLDLKHKIAALSAIPVSQQRLIFNGLQLEDYFLLSYYGIQNEAAIHMELRGDLGAREILDWGTRMGNTVVMKGSLTFKTFPGQNCFLETFQ